MKLIYIHDKLKNDKIINIHFLIQNSYVMEKENRSGNPNLNGPVEGSASVGPLGSNREAHGFSMGFI